MNSASMASVAHRQRVLRALGLTVWRRRAAPAAPPPTCVLVLPPDNPPRALDLLGRALHGFGPWLARAARVEVRAGRLEHIPPADVYVVFGHEPQQVLQQELAAAGRSVPRIIPLEPPQTLLEGAAGKRRLWVALRELRRATASLG